MVALRLSSRTCIMHLLIYNWICKFKSHDLTDNCYPTHCVALQQTCHSEGVIIKLLVTFEQTSSWDIPQCLTALSGTASKLAAKCGESFSYNPVRRED